MESISFHKGDSKIDLSKPIEIKDILFRKTNRFCAYTSSDNLPFEVVNKVYGADCYGYKKSYTILGVLLLELLFSKQSYIEIQIIHSLSEIKQLFFHLEKTEQPYLLKIDQEETYKSYKYFSRKVEKYPFSGFHNSERDVEVNNLPLCNFTCSNKQNIYHENTIQKADQLVINVNLPGLIELADLFLDIGNKENEQTEICLENPIYGNGGTHQRSIDMRFWLPNSFGFYTDNINDLQF